MKLKLAMFVTVVIGTFFAEVSRGSILNGSVSFNPDTNLFTYSYTINNISGPAAITKLDVLISNQFYDYDLNPPALKPLAHEDPPDSQFVIAVAGGSANPPLNESGTFWSWWSRRR